ncbi:MAG: hypothetical protein IPM16_16320 [Chloroflexi bacterium]|nr:hypothetical protein [Chloroflexota bacterium]
MTNPFRNRRTLFMLVVSAAVAVVSILAIVRFGPSDPEFAELRDRADTFFRAIGLAQYDETFALLDSGWQQQLESPQALALITTASAALPESYRFDGTVEACEAGGAQFKILYGTARVAVRDVVMAVYFHREIGQWRVRGVSLDGGVLGVSLPGDCMMVEEE